jgi:hypothetical protein
MLSSYLFKKKETIGSFYFLRKRKLMLTLFEIHFHIKQVTVRNCRREDKSKILKQQRIKPKMRKYKG